MPEQTEQNVPQTQAAAERSSRHVVEHALVDYGFSHEFARTLVDQLIAEGRDN